MEQLAHSTSAEIYSHHFPGTNFNGGLVMMSVWVIALALLVYFIYMLGRRQSESKDKESPTDILKRRLAEGEISESEYDSALKKLKE